MSTQRLNVTLPEDVTEILKTKKNKSEFLAEAVREKAINDKKKEIIEQARRLKKYLFSGLFLKSRNSCKSSRSALRL